MDFNWKTIEVKLGEDDMRTLNSANNNLGFRMMESIGVGIKIQISNPILLLRSGGGSVGSTNDTYIYDGSSLTSFYGYTNCLVDTELNGTRPIIEFAVMVDGWLGGTADSSPVGSRGTSTNSNGSIYLWNSNDLPLYVGTARIIFDYRYILAN